ncbi:MAG: hypothetical protein KIS88_08920 [Anaerolineales bacterium]|nr:hypothetical protein [Anaerolineales bacterium]
MITFSANQKTLCDIAQVAFEATSHLLSLDQNFAHQLRSGARSSRQFIREETITETLVGELVSNFPRHIELKLFTQPEESQNGADWYWRIERGTDAIHAVVQAKRIQRSEVGAFDDIGDIEINQKQMNRLINGAAKIPGLEAWLVTYARFDATPPCGCDIVKECSHHFHAGFCRNQQPSVWVAKAQDVANLVSSGATTLEIKEVIQESLRLDCLLPCINGIGHPLFSGLGPTGMPGPGMKGFILKSDLWHYEECLATIENDEQLRKHFRGALRIKLSAL